MACIPPLQDDPIVALATPAGRSGVAVLRLSGVGCLARVLPLLHLPPTQSLSDFPRTLRLCHLIDPVDGTRLDQILAVYFPAPHSYTGEEMVELHLHGAPLVVQQALVWLGALGLRLALPGEFSRRAFLNGKLDLMRAQGLAALIEAQSVSAARHAARQMLGAYSSELLQARERLLNLTALVEAHLDFADEELDALDCCQLAADLNELSTHLSRLAERSEVGRRYQDGWCVVIAGPPNVGKSTLFNRLAGHERAIVTPHAGTTRDLLEVSLELGGFPVTLVDTAGLRETSDPIEAEGVRRSRAMQQQADLLLSMRDALHPSEPTVQTVSTVVVWNKCDLLATASLPKCHPDESPLAEIYLSAKTGEGIDQLLAAVQSALTCEPLQLPLMLAEQQRQSLALALGEIDQTLAALAKGEGLELIAERMRIVLVQLDAILGIHATPDVLARIFARFCIGK